MMADDARAFGMFCDVIAVLWALCSLLPDSLGDDWPFTRGFCRGAAVAHLVAGVVVLHG